MEKKPREYLGVYLNGPEIVLTLHKSNGQASIWAGTEPAIVSCESVDSIMPRLAEKEIWLVGQGDVRQLTDAVQLYDFVYRAAAK